MAKRNSGHSNRFKRAKVLSDLRGETDLFGNLRGYRSWYADEIASAASLLMGQGKEGLPWYW
ncbi:MAG: hypothetical protein Ct9H300mP3_07660 [Gammaproteobacteria bacterium]|nr:MAG: hypothetical protein Ct9H300mP3_07660 [Gammaproteobacteria bacterium]